MEKNKPKPFSRKGAGEKGTPAAINHGNIPPSIDHEAGGVTMSHAIHTVVLSLAALRRLRFQQRADGSPIPAAERDHAETAARTALAALALVGVLYQRKNGYDLRSRSLLIAAEPMAFELVSNDGSAPLLFSVDDPAALLREALDAAGAVGLNWHAEPVMLRPTPKLTHLIAQSRKLNVVEGGDEDAG
jgi:CRISPR-associated protein Csb1